MKRRPVLLKMLGRLLLRLTCWPTGHRCVRVWVSSAMAPTTNRVLRLRGKQWLRRGLVVEREGLDKNQLLWLSGTQQ